MKSVTEKNISPLKILITGGSGFIGTNLVEYYLKRSYIVLNIDIKPPVNEKDLVSWHQIDINNNNELVNSFLNFDPDYIVHLAARTDLDGKALADYHTNVIGVQNVLEAANKCKRLKKIIIASSMLVCRVGYIPSNDLDYMPDTYYGESKVLTEKICRETEINSDWSIIRPTSIWGPNFKSPYRDFFEMVISKRYFHIGYKSCTKTYGYVGNAIYQINQIMFESAFNSHEKVFYIGDYTPYHIEEWGNEIAEHLNLKILRIPFFAFVIAAYLGDILKGMKINFPMSTFRLKNMTTNNILDLKKLEAIAPNLPHTRIEGIIDTLNWMQSGNKS